MLFPPDGRWRPRLTYFRFAATGVVAGLAVMFSTGVAQASPEFPEEIQELLALDCTPACVLCHRTPEGGLNNIREPFGAYIQGLGVFLDLPAAFAAAEQDPNGDSDMDGINDVAEIRANTNPNMADTPDNPSDPICAAAEYGCGARIAPSRGSAAVDKGWSLLAALGVALLLLRQRRRFL
jgi:hypothetical protein